MSEAREEFVEMVTEINKMKGFGNLSSKLIGELYVSLEDLTLEELSERTGYSVSAVSGTMKKLTNLSFIKRKKKPGTRKVFFSMEKNVIDNFLDYFENTHSKIIEKIERDVPEILEKYEEEEGERSIKEKEIVEEYYEDVMELDGCFKEFIDKLEDARGE